MVDFALWCGEQSAALLARDAMALDWDNLAEEVRDMGRSERRAIRSNLTNLLVHKMKILYFPSPDNDRGWRATIRHARREIWDVIADNPSLSGYPKEVLAACYASAREDVQADYGHVPAECPWSEEEVLK